MAEKPTSLPLWSLILAIVSYFCFPIILAIVAIILGFMGRKRAKEQGGSTGMATAGIVLGFLNIIIYAIVLVALIAGGVGIFSMFKGQADIAPDVKAASVAAESYGLSNNSYEGLTTAELADYGYVPSSTVTVEAVPINGGSGYCVEGYKNGDPGTKIHMPVLAGEAVFTLTFDNSTYTYATGPCPRS